MLVLGLPSQLYAYTKKVFIRLKFDSTCRAFALLDAGKVMTTDTKLVMPSSNSLKQQTLDLAHEGHQGITKTKALLRSKVWSPNIDSRLCCQ